MPGAKDYWRSKRHTTRTDAWSGEGQGFDAWLRTGSRWARRKDWMFALLAIFVVGPPVFAFAWPLVAAGTRDPCTGFETALLQRKAPTVRGVRHKKQWYTPTPGPGRTSASRGVVGQKIAATEHPWLPGALSCTILSWKVRSSE